MKRTFILSLMAILFFSSCSYIGGKRIKGNGNTKTETRSAVQFSNIDVSGAIDVYISQDSATSVKVEADENLMEYIDITNDGGTLTIQPKDRYNLKPSKKIKVYVSSPLFKQFEATGACGIYSQNKFTSSNDITINVTGASTVKMELNAPGIKADLTGASHINLKGETKNFSVEGSGATSIRCFEL
ncbi:MAG: head GIN domain-containing protein, partial [Bacteroidota bacterium]